MIDLGIAALRLEYKNDNVIVMDYSFSRYIFRPLNELKFMFNYKYIDVYKLDYSRKLREDARIRFMKTVGDMDDSYMKDWIVGKTLIIPVHLPNHWVTIVCVFGKERKLELK
jgi:hypothetical protein